jgi:hypothetical protein
MGEFTQQVEAYSKEQLLAEFEDRRTQLYVIMRTEAQTDFDSVADLYVIEMELQRRNLFRSPEYDRAVLSADKRAWEIWEQARA